MTIANEEFSWTRWAGSWIGVTPTPRSPEAAADDQFDLAAHGRGFSRALFQRPFTLDAVPETAPLRITADSRFVLWVNGQEVGRGPVRSQPRRWKYEQYDIAPLLKAGANSIAVLVTYFGTPTPWWQPAPVESGISGDICLVVDCSIGDLQLNSDAAWKVHRSTAWTSYRQTVHLPAEIFDARELPEGWCDADFDSSSWSSATVLATTHPGGLARSKPPVNPYGALHPRPVAQLGGQTVSPVEIFGSAVITKPTWSDPHPAMRAMAFDPVGALSLPAELPLTGSIDQDRAIHAVFDFGRIVAGFVELEIEAPAGVIFELGYRERKPEDGPGLELDYRAGARYTTKGVKETYSATEISGLRYIHIVVHTDDVAAVTIHSVSVRENHYPDSGDASFESDDASLNRIYWAGRRTVQLNAFDSFTDCPTREQRAWVGDGVVHQMVHLTTNDDWRLAKYYVELANSPRPDGMLPMSVVGEFEFSQGFSIPDWALHWIHGVHNLFRYTGDRDLVQRYLPTIERILRWYEPYIDEHGTLSDVPEWNLVDWSSVFTTGRTSIVSALWARGLREYAELSEWLGNAGSASWARGLWVGVAAGYEDFWDESRGLYIDHFLDGEPQAAASQAAGAAAIVSGLAPQERWKPIVEKITDPSRLVIRSWVGGSDGYDHEKTLEMARGIQTIDWDAEREIVRAEPFFSYVVHDAVAQAGMADHLITLVRDWEVFLTDGYDTFGECWEYGTPVHGWSATPTRDLISYVLGITPDTPGFATVKVEPRPGRLGRVTGSAPTPHGLVHVSIDSGQVAIDSPVPVRFVDLAGNSFDLAAGKSNATLRN